MLVFEKQDPLKRLLPMAEDSIVYYLRNHGTCPRTELEPYVLSVIDTKRNKDEDLIHDTQPIHRLAFIMAFKDLEKNGRIKIARPDGVPFPMTDYKTLFSTIT